jgi:hypothetical protein
MQFSTSFRFQSRVFVSCPLHICPIPKTRVFHITLSPATSLAKALATVEAVSLHHQNVHREKPFNLIPSLYRSSIESWPLFDAPCVSFPTNYQH